MRIEYCRWAGSLALSELEPGTRGSWWEKRRALLGWLRHRTHDVQLLGKLSRESRRDPRLETWLQQAAAEPSGRADLLMVEFGSHNSSWHGEQHAQVRAWVEKHASLGRPWLYLCDDPDLGMPGGWSDAAARAATVVVNMPLDPALEGELADLCEGAEPVDLPFGALIPRRLGAPPPRARDHLVYIGRPSARTSYFRELDRHGLPWQPYGRAAEWAQWAARVAAAPAQPGRGEFYAASLAALGIADRTHERLGWRTGRIDHAIAAGCPVAAPRGHAVGATGAFLYRNTVELAEWLAPLREDAERHAAEVARQRHERRMALDFQLERAARELGL